VSADATWVDEVIEGWTPDPVPELCQEWACNEPAQTWCPLCRAFFCAYHDELVPVRRHACLKGHAEA